MNDDDLQRQLRKLPSPVASATTRGRAKHRALLAFESSRFAPEKDPAKTGFAWNWRYATALALALGFLPVFFFPRPHSTENLAADRQMLEQVEKLFPNQVDSVVVENGKINLTISQTPVLGSDQPVVVLFKRGRETIRVLSYSGHRVCLKLGSKENCFEILATPSGGIILEGANQAWLASDHPHVSGYSVRAQTLKASL